MKLAPALLLFALTGCTALAPFLRHRPLYDRIAVSRGFSEIPLADNRYRVAVEGDNAATESQISKLALVRAAQLAYRLGYTHLIVTKKDVQDVIDVLPNLYHEIPPASPFDGHSELIGPDAVILPAPLLRTLRHRVTLTVRLLHDPEKSALDAIDILSSEGPAVGISLPELLAP